MELPPIIQIIPLGEMPRTHLAAAAAAVRERLGCEPVVLPVVPVPPESWRSTRQQHDADALLASLFDRLALDVCRIVGVTHVDLFADGRNYVFGYAHMRDRVAVVSTHRLGSQANLEKAIVHELGHTFHVPHCGEDACVMRQVEQVGQLQALGSDYCSRCMDRVASAVRRGIDTAEAFFELAGAYMRRRRPGRAVAAYHSACERDSQNPHYANDLGVAYFALGASDCAMLAFERAIALAPTFSHAYYNLGILFRARGDIETADSLFTAALERDVDRRSAHRYLGILHQDYFRDPPRARAYLERYVALGGTDVEVRRRLRQLCRRGMDELAINSRSMVVESTLPV